MQYGADLTSLEKLIAHLGGAEIGTQSAGSYGLLLEHLQGARRGLLGSMQAEYRSSLGFAKESLACISGTADRADTKKILQGLIDSAVPA
jgi:hypothetical protein